MIKGFGGGGLSPPSPRNFAYGWCSSDDECWIAGVFHCPQSTFFCNRFFSIYNVISGTKMIVLKQAFCITDTDVSLMLRLNCRLQLSGNLPMSPPCLPFSGRIYTPWPELPPSFPSPRKHSAKSQTFVPWFVESQAQSVKLHIKCHINQH